MKIQTKIILAAILLIEVAIAIYTYLGRIYEKQAFKPEQVSFLENYIVLHIVVWVPILFILVIVGLNYEIYKTR